MERDGVTFTFFFTVANDLADHNQAVGVFFLESPHNEVIHCTACYCLDSSPDRCLSVVVPTTVLLQLLQLQLVAPSIPDHL